MAFSTELARGSQLSRRARLAPPVGLAVAAAVATLALHFRDPHVEGSWGFCPFKFLTGLDCPGCGGLRAVNNLTDLDFAGAASSNLLFIVAIPFLLALWVIWMRRAWQGKDGPMTFTTPVTTMVLVVTIAFAIARNTPYVSWLAS